MLRAANWVNAHLIYMTCIPRTFLFSEKHFKHFRSYSTFNDFYSSFLAGFWWKKNAKNSAIHHWWKQQKKHLKLSTCHSLKNPIMMWWWWDASFFPKWSRWWPSKYWAWNANESKFYNEIFHHPASAISKEQNVFPVMRRQCEKLRKEKM